MICTNERKVQVELLGLLSSSSLLKNTVFGLGYIAPVYWPCDNYFKSLSLVSICKDVSWSQEKDTKNKPDLKSCREESFLEVTGLVEEKCDSVFLSVWVLYCCSECEILAGARPLKKIRILCVKMISPLKREKLRLPLTVGTGFSPLLEKFLSDPNTTASNLPWINTLQYYNFPTFCCNCRAPFVHKTTSWLPYFEYSLGQRAEPFCKGPSSGLICSPFQPTLLAGCGTHLPD